MKTRRCRSSSTIRIYTQLDDSNRAIYHRTLVKRSKLWWTRMRRTVQGSSPDNKTVCQRETGRWCMVSRRHPRHSHKRWKGTSRCSRSRSTSQYRTSRTLSRCSRYSSLPFPWSLPHAPTQIPLAPRSFSLFRPWQTPDFDALRHPTERHKLPIARYYKTVDPSSLMPR